MLFRDDTNVGGPGKGAVGQDAAGGGGVADAGGTGQGAGSAADAAGAGAGAGGGSSSQSGTDQSKVELEQLRKTVADKERAFKELQDAHDKLGNKHGALKKFADVYTKTPMELVKILNEEHKLGLSLGGNSDSDVTLPANVATMKSEELKAVLDKRDAAILAQAKEGARSDVARELEVSRQLRMTQKYDDWDKAAEGRQILSMSRLNGDLHPDEILHLAVRGANLPKILADHKDFVIKEYQAELEKKRGASLSGGGGAGRESGVPAGAKDIRTDPEQFGAVVGRLQKATR
jgi:hypothetical protein